MRADRLISIIMHLQSKSRTAKELSQLLEVSERTIYRDMDALSSAGIPIHADSGLGGGFTLAPGYRTKMDGLNTSEIHALFLQMNEQPFKQLGIDQSMRSAMLKIFNSLSEQLRMDAEWIRNRVFLDMRSWRQQQEHAHFMKQVQQSVWQQRKVIIMYTDRFHAKHELELDPYGLVMKAGMWFVVGKGGRGMQAFRVTRLDSFQLTDRQFERGDGFDLEAFWLEWIADYEKKQSQYSVILAASEEALSRISRMSGVTLETNSLREAGSAQEDWVEAKVCFENKEAALAAVLAQGWHVKVMAPQELRDSISKQAEHLLTYYSGPPGKILS